MALRTAARRCRDKAENANLDRTGEFTLTSLYTNDAYTMRVRGVASIRGHKKCGTGYQKVRSLFAMATGRTQEVAEQPLKGLGWVGSLTSQNALRSVYSEMADDKCVRQTGQ